MDQPASSINEHIHFRSFSIARIYAAAIIYEFIFAQLANSVIDVTIINGPVKTMIIPYFKYRMI